MPDQTPALSALRRTFRQTGSIVAVSLATSVMSASTSPAAANAVVFAALAAIMIVGVVVGAQVPNQRGRW